MDQQVNSVFLICNFVARNARSVSIRRKRSFGRAFPSANRYKRKYQCQEVVLAGCDGRSDHMVSISVQKLEALIRSLERLYSADNLKQFPSTVFRALSEIIEGGGFSLDTVDLKTGEVISEASENPLISAEIKNRTVELVPTNPAIPRVREGSKDAIRLSSCIAQRRFEQAPLHLDVSVSIRKRHRRVVPLEIPGHAASVTVNRDTDFTDEETLLLSFAAAHVALVHRNLKRLASLRAAGAQLVPGPQDLERIGLTAREAEVLHWVMKGKQDGAIAGILKISVRTVHNHVARILKKLQSESRASASYEAMLKLKALWSHPRPIQHSNTPSVRLLYPSTSAPSKIDLESKSA